MYVEEFLLLLDIQRQLTIDYDVIIKLTIKETVQLVLSVYHIYKK